MTDTPPLLEVENVVKHFPLPRGLVDAVRGIPPKAVHAVDGVSLAIRPGETLGLIGESGSGKTTLGWVIARLLPASAGTLRLSGVEADEGQGPGLLAWRRQIRIVFQDPVGSLDPRLRAWQVIGEALQAQNHMERQFALGEPARIVREHRNAVRREEQRLWLACHPAEEAKRSLMRDYRAGVEQRAKAFEEGRARLEGDYRDAVGRLRERARATAPSKGSRGPSPEIVAERERLTRGYRLEIARRDATRRQEEARIGLEFRAALLQAGRLRLPPDEQKRRTDAYRAFRKQGLPPPVIPDPRPPATLPGGDPAEGLGGVADRRAPSGLPRPVSS